MISNLLVLPNDLHEDQNALHRAVTLTKTNESASKIHLLDVWHTKIDDFASTDQIGSLEQKISEQRIEALHKLLTRLNYTNNPNITCNTINQKYQSEAISTFCEEKKIELIIRCREKEVHSSLSPAEYRLLRTTNIPVYFASPKEIKAGQTILVAVDIASKNPAKQELNHKVMKFALKLAENIQGKILCCAVIEIPTLVKDMDLIDVPRHIDNKEKDLLPKLTAFASQYNISKDQVIIKDGAPESVIRNLAKKNKAACVLLGTVQRKGISGVVIGNAAERIIQHARTDIAVVPLRSY